MLNELLNRYPQLSVCKDDIIMATNTIIDCYKNGGKVLICGNGGSASDSAHIVGELMKGFIKKRPLSNNLKKSLKNNNSNLSDEFFSCLQGSLPAINLCENSAIISAFANDVNPDFIYAQEVLGYGKPQDVFIGITTSGNSVNVLNAVQVAKGLGLKTIGLTGRDGGKLKTLCDISVVVPEDETFKIQELHLPVYHVICALVEQEFFKE